MHITVAGSPPRWSALARLVVAGFVLATLSSCSPPSDGSTDTGGPTGTFSDTGQTLGAEHSTDVDLDLVVANSGQANRVYLNE